LRIDILAFWQGLVLLALVKWGKYYSHVALPSHRLSLPVAARLTVYLTPRRHRIQICASLDHLALLPFNFLIAAIAGYAYRFRKAGGELDYNRLYCQL
jgi:hypothetical protein